MSLDESNNENKKKCLKCMSQPTYIKLNSLNIGYKDLFAFIIFNVSKIPIHYSLNMYCNI